MRVNIYAEELTDEFEVVTTEADNGRLFYGIRVYLESSEKLHHTKDDDDRSAITFWIPWTANGGHNFRWMRDTFPTKFLTAINHAQDLEGQRKMMEAQGNE